MEGFQVTRVVSSLLSSVAIAACEVQRVNWPARTRNEHESVLVNCGIDAETVNIPLSVFTTPAPGRALHKH